MQRKILLRTVCAGWCALVLCLTLGGPATGENAGSYEVQDITGKAYHFESPPGRIISTAPSITEILFSLELDDRIKGVTDNCNYPPAARELPRIGDINPAIEKIVSLRPDLIVADRNLELTSLSALEKLGFKVFTIDCRNIQSFTQSLLLLGKVNRKEGQASLLVQDMQERIGKIQERIRADRHDVTVFVEIWDKPIITAGSQTLFDDLIHLAGGVNIFADSTTGYPEVSLETLILRDPQVIVLTTSKKEDVVRRSAWKGLSAVKSGRIYDIDPDIIARPTLRMVEALEILAIWLHPGIRAKSVNFAGRKHYGPPKGSHEVTQAQRVR